ncbi:MAG: hypothetical protein ACK5L3_11000 [Oscillospiraceae bacterium]
MTIKLYILHKKREMFKAQFAYILHKTIAFAGLIGYNEKEESATAAILPVVLLFVR